MRVKNRRRHNPSARAEAVRPIAETAPARTGAAPAPVVIDRPTWMRSRRLDVIAHGPVRPAHGEPGGAVGCGHRHQGKVTGAGTVSCCPSSPGRSSARRPGAQRHPGPARRPVYGPGRTRDAGRRDRLPPMGLHARGTHRVSSAVPGCVTSARGLAGHDRTRRASGASPAARHPAQAFKQRGSPICSPVRRPARRSLNDRGHVPPRGPRGRRGRGRRRSSRRSRRSAASSRPSQWPERCGPVAAPAPRSGRECASTRTVPSSFARSSTSGRTASTPSGPRRTPPKPLGSPTQGVGHRIHG